MIKRKNWVWQFQFFCQVQRGDHRIPPTSLAKFEKLHSTVSNVLKFVENHFFDQDNVFPLVKLGMTISIFFWQVQRGESQDTTNEYCKFSEFALERFKRSQNCWKPFIWSKQSLSTHKNWVWQFQFFFDKFKGGTTGYHQRFFSKFQKLDSTTSNALKIVENHFFDQNNVLRVVKTGYDNFNFFCQVQRGDHRISPTNIANFRNCLKPLQTF